MESHDVSKIATDITAPYINQFLVNSFPGVFTMTSRNNDNKLFSKHDIKHSDPIPINSSARKRSASVSSTSSSSGSSASELPTPISASGNHHRIQIPSPGSSPILSYFLAQSPTKAPPNAPFPFKRNLGATPVFEEEERELPSAVHARRASTFVAGRFSQPQTTALPEPQQERGAGLLRRLSLSSAAFIKPQPSNEGQSASMTSPPPPNAPPNSAVSPVGKAFPSSPRRAATISAEGGRRRAPSPMGERILKGHFDGFN